jgi:hypothetical protein
MWKLLPKGEKRRRHDWYSFFTMFAKFYQVVNGGGDSLWPSSQTVHDEFDTQQNEQTLADFKRFRGDHLHCEAPHNPRRHSSLWHAVA